MNETSIEKNPSHLLWLIILVLLLVIVFLLIRRPPGVDPGILQFQKELRDGNTAGVVVLGKDGKIKPFHRSLTPAEPCGSIGADKKFPRSCDKYIPDKRVQAINMATLLIYEGATIGVIGDPDVVPLCPHSDGSSC